MREIIISNQETGEKGFVDPKLVDYVAQCRKMRIADEEIRRKLLKVGWLKEAVDRILGKAKTEANISFLSPSAKPVFDEKTNLKAASEEGVKKESPKKEKKIGFFSKRTILIILTILLALLALAFVGYYFLSRKNIPAFQNKEPEKNTEAVAETDCGLKKFKKPESTGSVVFRVDSTMKLLINAINEGNYCWTMSLFSDESKDKQRELVKIVIEDEEKRNKFLADLNGYMIPAIDENDPEAQAKATITSADVGGNSTFYIIFSENESGQYLISSM